MIDAIAKIKFGSSEQNFPVLIQHRINNKKMAAFLSGHLGRCFAHIPMAMVDLLFKFDSKI